jgi:hypothetical protein
MGIVHKLRLNYQEEGSLKLCDVQDKTESMSQERVMDVTYERPQ